MNPPVYLDYNATAPLRPAAAEAVARAQGLTGNPSSVHSFGRQARAAVETARELVAALAGAKPAQVVFTSGGTEANNLALAGSGRARILVSTIEHDSLLTAASTAERIPVTADGVVDLAALERLLQARTTLIIAHRLSTVKSVNRIAVIDQGRLVGVGSHDELLTGNPLYARLAALQFGA